MEAILIQGGRVLDPESGLDATGDVLLAGGQVRAIEAKPKRLKRAETACVIDAEGLIVCPGLIDPHVHLREPSPPEGQPGHHDETIATGVAAAIQGGFSTVCCMPNTLPPLDSSEMVQLVHERAEAAGQARVFVVACATKGRRGRELSDALIEASKVRARRGGSRSPIAFSDDGDAVAEAAVMDEALRAVRRAGRCFMQHCQEPSLTRDATMNAGPIAERLEQVGWPNVAEELILERDLRLNRTIGCCYHAQHLSSGESAAILRRARRDGQPATGEVSPHHLLLTDGDVEQAFASKTANPAHFKMNPPLRTRHDIAMLKEAVADGTITILATDHAPHPELSKSVEFARASFGIVGLDCALPLYVRALVDEGVIGWERLIAMLTIEPARLVGVDRLGLGSLVIGGPADVTLIDPALPWRIRAAEFATAGRNCPFADWDVRGRAVGVIVGGQVRLSRLGGRVTKGAAALGS